MRELAAEKIDAGNELLQNVESATLRHIALRLVPAVACWRRRWVFCWTLTIFPEVLVDYAPFVLTSLSCYFQLEHLRSSVHLQV